MKMNTLRLFFLFLNNHTNGRLMIPGIMGRECGSGVELEPPVLCKVVKLETIVETAKSRSGDDSSPLLLTNFPDIYNNAD